MQGLTMTIGVALSIIIKVAAPYFWMSFWLSVHIPEAVILCSFAHSAGKLITVVET